MGTLMKVNNNGAVTHLLLVQGEWHKGIFGVMSLIKYSKDIVGERYKTIGQREKVTS